MAELIAMQNTNQLTCSVVAAGLGYGVVSGAFATVNIFRDLSGPGTIGIAGDSKFFFLVSGIHAAIA